MYNPNKMRWICYRKESNGLIVEKNGCFNIKCRPKIEIFSDCFPGNINFGDIDGMVEINGFGLLLEWKSLKPILKVAQEIMYKKLTKTGLISVIAVFGDAEMMVVKKHCWFRMGKCSEGWVESNLDKTKDEIKAWVKYYARVGDQGDKL